MNKRDDLIKVSIVTILGISILILSLFWLKGYKLYGEKKVQVFFEDVSGLEEGAIVRWSGLRVGVVESIKPVLVEKKSGKESFEENKYFKLAETNLKQMEEFEKSLLKVKDLKERETLQKNIDELKEITEIYLKQGIASKHQKLKENRNHVVVKIVITRKDVPFGPLSEVSIVPSGLIGEHYVEISPQVSYKSTKMKFDPLFITKEPIRFERFLKANIESAEAFRDAITQINKILKDEDVELLIATVQDVRLVVKNVNKLVDNASVLLATTSEKLEQLATSSNLLSSSVIQVGENINKIIGDEQVRKDLKTTTSSLSTITTQVARLLDEEGLAKDLIQIGQTATETSTELSNFIKDLRQTQEELELPRTVSNLNSLSEKLDKLTNELNSIIADKEFKENIKVTVEKARETSENLEKLSKKFNKRFLFFRLLF